MICATSSQDIGCKLKLLPSVFIAYHANGVFFVFRDISEAISKLIAPHPTKRFESGDHYYLFVDFAHAGEASAAVSALDGQEGPWGGKLKVGKARGESSVKSEERPKWSGSRDRRPEPEAPIDA
jgi:hypothetical protein